MKLSREVIATQALGMPSGHYAQGNVVRIGAVDSLLFVSGMTARKVDGSIAGVGDVGEQPRPVCRNLQAALESAGSSLEDICRVDVFIRNMEHFAEIHAARREFFKDPLPASTMVEVNKMVHPDMLIEINAIAVTHRAQ